MGKFIIEWHNAMFEWGWLVLTIAGLFVGFIASMSEKPLRNISLWYLFLLLTLIPSIIIWIS